MYERELQNKILAILYKQYRNNGCVKLVISELSKNIPEVTLERVFEMCKKLNEQKYIRCTFLTGNDGLINEITVDGRSYVEESLLPQKDTQKNVSNQLIIMDTARIYRPEDKIYQFFISSTYEDLKEERQAVMSAVISTGNVPVGMEYFPASDKSQFDYIKQLIDKVDYYIIISAGKYGSINEETGLSYTEMEYDYAVSKNVPIATFPIQDFKKLTGDKLELSSRKIDLLEAFRKKIMATKVCNLWTNKDNLRAYVLQTIPSIIKESPRIGWIRASSYAVKNDDQDLNLDVVFDIHPLKTEYDVLFDGMDNHVEQCIKKIKLRQIIECLGPYLKKMIDDYFLEDLLEKRLSIENPKDKDLIIKEMIKMKLIQRFSVNNELEGTCVKYTFTDKGIKIWTSLD